MEYSTLFTMGQAGICLRVLAKDGYAKFEGGKELQSFTSRAQIDAMLARLLLTGKAVLVDVDEAISGSFDLDRAKNEGLVELVSSSKESESRFDSMMTALESGQNSLDCIVDPLSIPVSIEDPIASCDFISQVARENEVLFDDLESIEKTMTSHLQKLSNTAREISALWPCLVSDVFSYYYRDVFELASQTCGYTDFPKVGNGSSPQNLMRLFNMCQEDLPSDFEIARFFSQFKSDTKALFNYSLNGYPYLDLEDFVGDTITGSYEFEEFCAKYAYMRTMREIQNLAYLTKDGSYTFASSSASSNGFGADDAQSNLATDDELAVYKVALDIDCTLPQPHTIDDILRLREHSQYEKFVSKIQEWTSLKSLDSEEQLLHIQNDISEASKGLKKVANIDKSLKRFTRFLGLFSISLGLVEPVSGTIIGLASWAADVSSEPIVNQYANKFKWIEFGK